MMIIRTVCQKLEWRWFITAELEMKIQIIRGDVALLPGHNNTIDFFFIQCSQKMGNNGSKKSSGFEFSLRTSMENKEVRIMF